MCISASVGKIHDMGKDNMADAQLPYPSATTDKLRLKEDGVCGMLRQSFSAPSVQLDRDSFSSARPAAATATDRKGPRQPSGIPRQSRARAF